MKIRAKITSTDKGYAALLARLGTGKATSRAKLGVGMHADTFATPHPAHPGTFGMIGEANETGTAKIPPRPFIRQWFDFHLFDLSKTLNDRMMGLVAGRFATVEAALASAGQKFQSGMKEYILSERPFVPNAPKTVKWKGFNLPLVETGATVNSLRFEVDPSGTKFQ